MENRSRYYSEYRVITNKRCFSILQESEHFRNVAIQRFSEHLPYYVNQEGVTLLHSAEYNYGGVRLFSMVMRLYTLSELPIPEDWWGRYHKVVNFYDTLQRPDRTLPMIGDTRSIADWFGPPKHFRWKILLQGHCVAKIINQIMLVCLYIQELGTQFGGTQRIKALILYLNHNLLQLGHIFQV